MVVAVVVEADTTVGEAEVATTRAATKKEGKAVAIKAVVAAVVATKVVAATKVEEAVATKAVVVVAAATKAEAVVAMKGEVEVAIVEATKADAAETATIKVVVAEVVATEAEAETTADIEAAVVTVASVAAAVAVVDSEAANLQPSANHHVAPPVSSLKVKCHHLPHNRRMEIPPMAKAPIRSSTESVVANPFSGTRRVMPASSSTLCEIFHQTALFPSSRFHLFSPKVHRKLSLRNTKVW